MALALGAGVATGVTEDAPEGVDGGVKEESEATVEAEPDGPIFLGIGRAFAAEKWGEPIGGFNLVALLFCCIFLVSMKVKLSAKASYLHACGPNYLLLAIKLKVQL
jgi:hypothetical protein